MPWMPVGINPFHIANPKPGRHYRWLKWTNKTHLANWLHTHGDRPGYKLTQCDTVKDTKKLANELGPGETYVNDAKNRIEYGDVVLAELPIEEAARRDKEKMEDQHRASQSASDAEEFMGNVDASSKYIKPIKRQFGEMVDRRKHAERDGKSFVSLSAGNPA